MHWVSSRKRRGTTSYAAFSGFFLRKGEKCIDTEVTETTHPQNVTSRKNLRSLRELQSSKDAVPKILFLLKSKLEKK